MMFSRAVQTMTLVLLATACDVKVGVDDGAFCSATKPCPSGQFCFNAICAVGCMSNQDCASDQFCATETDRLCHNTSTTSTDAGVITVKDAGTTQQPICTTANPCPAGQFCFNGLCALGCASNQNCASDQYCATETDRLCHNKVVTTCPEVPCASNQVCTSGFCSTPPPPTVCDPEQLKAGQADGCTVNALCIDPASTPAEDPACYTFPACAQDKTCPTGTQGALCNDGLIPNKALICLPGHCKSAANCPPDWSCFKVTSTDVVGACSNKGMGAPCKGPTDCLSGTCNVIVVGFPGFCM